MARDFVTGDGATGLIDPLDFHPCDTPRGMMYYKMDVLTDAQQKKLNDLKRRTVVEDEKYLAKHPQVRACVAIMIREVLKERPRCNVHDTIAKYFAQPRTNIEADISDYINSRRIVAREGDSHVDLLTSATSLISQFDSIDKVTQTMSLDITRSFRELGKHISEQTKESPYKTPAEQELPDEKIIELFIRNILAESVDASILSKEIEDLEEVLRIESYRHFQDLFVAEDTRSQESAGFLTTETSKPEIPKDEAGKLHKILEELIQKTINSVVHRGEPGINDVRERDEVEVEEIREIIVGLLQSVEMADVGTGIERTVDIDTNVQKRKSTITKNEQNLKSEPMVTDDVQNLKSEPIVTQEEQNLMEIENKQLKGEPPVTENEQNIKEKPVAATEDEQNVKDELVVTGHEQNLKGELMISEDVQRLKDGPVVTEDEQNLKGELMVTEDVQNLKSEPMVTDD